MDQLYLLELVSILNDYYTTYRYKVSPDCYSFPYNEIENIKEKQRELDDFFINRPWNTYESTWRHIDLVAQDIVHRSLGGFLKIKKIIIDEENELLSFQYDFLCDLEKLYNFYDLLIDDKLEEAERQFPLLNEKNIENEIDQLSLIKSFTKQMVSISEVETV